MFRMTPTKFEELYSKVSLFLSKPNARREPIGPEERLFVTLRYLVTGDAFTTIGHSYRISDTSVGRIVKETCKILWDRLLFEGFLKCPTTEEEWKETADEFNKYWNFPNLCWIYRWKACYYSMSKKRWVYVL